VSAIAHASIADASTPTGTADWARLLAPGVIWGSSFFFIAEGLRSFPAALITPMRLAFGFCALAAFPAARKTSISGHDLRRIVVLGVVWMAFPLSMFPFAEERVSSSLTGMLNGATPLFVTAVAALLARAVPPPLQLLGLAVGTVGVVLIAVPGWDGDNGPAGVMMILAALASYGVALNMAVPLQRRYGSLPVMWRAQAVALALTVPFAVPAVDDVRWAWWPCTAVLLLGVLGTALAYVLAADNAGRLGSTRASVTTYIIPVVSLLLGAAIRNEAVFVLALIGCALALCGAYLTATR
jgi:drug/metabolite transporter (DMT)-like permease